MVRATRRIRRFSAANTCDVSTRTRGVAAGHVRRHRSSARLGALELRDEASPSKQPQVGLAAIGGVCPDNAGSLVGIEQSRKLAAMARGVGCGEAANETVGAVYTEVVLKARNRRGDLADHPPLGLARRRRLLAATSIV